MIAKKEQIILWVAHVGITIGVPVILILGIYFLAP
tara:strand:+ start:823 stop:927 length:105 start_codon:yes stop_codon:yes gene_type:complete